MAKIPRTEGRLAVSIELFATSYEASNGTLWDTKLDPTIFSAKPLGSCNSIDITQTTHTAALYSITKPDIGTTTVSSARVPFKQTVKTIEPLTVTLNKVMLYREDAMQAFGFQFGQLVSQNKPIAIKVVFNRPGFFIPEIQGSSILYCLDCWLTRYPIDANLTGEILMTQSLTFSCSFVKVGSGWSLSLKPVTEKLTEKVVKFLKGVFG